MRRSRANALPPPTTLCGVGPRASLGLVVIALVVVSHALIETRAVRFEARAVQLQLETLARRLDAAAAASPAEAVARQLELAAPHAQHAPPAATALLTVTAPSDAPQAMVTQKTHCVSTSCTRDPSIPCTTDGDCLSAYVSPLANRAQFAPFSRSPISALPYCAEHPADCVRAVAERNRIEHYVARRRVAKSTERFRAALDDATPSHACDGRAPVKVVLHDDWWRTQSHILDGIVAHLGECATRCEVDAAYRNGGGFPDAHVFLQASVPKNVPDQRAWQKRAVLGLEPGYGQHLDETLRAGGADILMSWSLKADVPVNYYYGFSHPGLPKERWSEACRGIACMNVLHAPDPHMFSTHALAPTFVSNCAAQPRARFLVELGKHMKLHHYGGCWHSPELPPSTGYNDNFKLEVSGKYKFHFAFEVSTFSPVLSFSSSPSKK